MLLSIRAQHMRHEHMLVMQVPNKSPGESNNHSLAVNRALVCLPVSQMYINLRLMQAAELVYG